MECLDAILSLLFNVFVLMQMYMTSRRPTGGIDAKNLIINSD